MKVRQEVYDTYWKFAAKRQEVFFKRIEHRPYPWTDDPIISHYKFCNTYRASDRVSQYLIKHVIYDKDSHNEEDTIFRILLFKIFNKIETWDFLEHEFGSINLRIFDFQRFADALQRRLDMEEPIYTSAYMSCANKAFGFDKKHLNHLALIRQMTQCDRIAVKIANATSLDEIFGILRSYPLIGDFMAYQLAIDLNYSEIVNFSENSFTVPGPGAERGIRKCFSDVEGKTFSEIIYWMVENQEREFEKLGLQFQSLFGRPLHAIDCQGLFCETDKYSRVQFPELTSNRKRIKASFHPAPRRIEYFYPPKWGINDALVTDANWQEAEEEIFTPTMQQLSFLDL